MGVPSVLSHAISGMGSPSARSPMSTGRPSKNCERRNVGCSWRRWVITEVNSTSGVSTFSQLIHVSSLSWQYVLLLPFWVRPASSPCNSMGVPWDSMSVAMKLRC